jgi:methyltransferase (TIGR00027 family)
MTKNKPSTTAVVTALIRVSSHLDTVARIFLPQPFKLLSHFSLFNNFLAKRMPSGSYQSVVDRTKFIDYILKKKSFNQVVIFGAGFDSRFVRFYHPKTKFFEIDIKETQLNKINLIQKSKYKINENIIFIPFNLNNRGVGHKLIEKSFDPNQKTLFLLEGLIMYLKPKKIDTLFESIRRLGNKNSEIVFDYLDFEIVKNRGLEANQVVSKLQENWLFGIDNVDNFSRSQKLAILKTQKINNGGIIEAKLVI